jgi:contractile injection system tube protein
MADTGRLERLVIRAHLKPDYSDEPTPDNIFEAYVNPSEITLGYEVEYDGASGSGTTGSRMEFKKIKPGELSLSFFIDGTGANGRPADVRAEVDKFQRVTGYSGHLHRTHYLKVAWGTLQVKRCVLKSASIAYKLFQPDGVPLRAVISASFTDNSDDTTRVAMAQDESADLTHVRLVRAGDTLPGLCQAIYGEPRMYAEVARANALDNFRDLPAGMQLRFPPLAK